MSATPTASRSNSLVPPPLALRSPLGAVTNVSQRFAELDKCPEKVQDMDNEDEVFSQDDQLDQTKVTSQQHEPVNPKTKKGKNKQVSKAESSSGALEKPVELSVTLTRPNLKPVPGAKGKSSKPSHADTMVRCVKETTYTTFQSSIIAAAIKAGLSATGYTDLDVEGKISAGGVWKNKQRLHDETAFQSFWDKILKKKAWEAYVFVAQSPMAVIELSSDSGVKTEEDSEDENSIEKQLLSAATADTKKRKGDESQSNTAASTSNKRAKVVVKNEAEEARKKSAADILRRHACSKHGAKACFILRGGIHLPIDNQILNRWVAAIERDPAANSSAHLPNDKYVEKQTKEAYLKQGLRASPTRAERPRSSSDYTLLSDFDEELPNLFSSAEMSHFRRRSGISAGASQSRGSPSASSSAATNSAPPRQAGPDITFEALAKRVKLDDAIIQKCVKVGVKKASAFARMSAENFTQIGCLEGEVEEALDAQDRWRRLDSKGFNKDELVNAPE